MDPHGDVRAALDESAELAERILRRKLDLAEAAAMDAGFPVKITMLETDIAVRHLRTMEEEVPWVEGGEPYGTVAAIFPYDAPIIMLARLGGGAILSSNFLRFSFSSWTPRCAQLLKEIAEPFKTLQSIVGRDNREFGHRCIVDDSVRVLFISGSSAVGETYRQHHKAFDKLFFAGPGGMPAVVAFEDADPEAVSRFIARRAFINGGQYCTTIKKALIHSSLYEPVRDKVLELTRQIKVGDPLDSDTEIGPVKVERTITILRHAVDKCAGALLCGGIDGKWVHPMIMEMEDIPDLELFGPFLALKSFNDPEKILQEVTRTRYGFLLSYFGTPPEGGVEVIRENFGMVFDNPDFVFTPMRAPFGGKKESGWILERRGEEWMKRDGGFLYSRELVRNG
jgi:acyl-CoA reductase-like NAD-dependent aldehyde dehydrogenase